MRPPKHPRPSAEASSAANVTSHSSVRTRVRMLPSPSATRRITRTSVPFSSSLICSAIALIYGVQYQVSNSAGVMVLGSLRAKASSGLVSALTYRRRYCPGLFASCCAMASEATMASSSGPPVVKIPTTVQRHLRWTCRSPPHSGRRPPSRRISWQRPCQRRNPWNFPLNHFPSTCHQGFVFSIPVS